MAGSFRAGHYLQESLNKDCFNFESAGYLTIFGVEILVYDSQFLCKRVDGNEIAL